MDPPAMMHDGAFQSGNAAPFNFAEIWPFPINGAEDLRRMQFAQFAENATMNRDGSGSDPMVLDQRGGSHGSRKRRDAAADEDDSGKIASTSTGNGVNNSDGKRIKTGGESMDEKHDPKADGEVNSSKQVEKNKKAPEPPKQDYIHVRARRGQATDSHSLAERARREKISERMKILQDLVPGCNKVIGKALVLDEIINYVQSLQRQVEFLSMKLEAVNSRAEPGIEEYPPKDFGRQTYDASGVGFSTQGTSDYGRGSSPEWLHMQLGGGFERTS